MLDKLREGLQNAVNKLVGAPTVDEKEIKEFVKDVQRSLLPSDVNLKIVLEVSQRIEKELSRKNLHRDCHEKITL